MIELVDVNMGIAWIGINGVGRQVIEGNKFKGLTVASIGRLNGIDTVWLTDEESNSFLLTEDTSLKMTEKLFSINSWKPVKNPTVKLSEVLTIIESCNVSFEDDKEYIIGQLIEEFGEEA